MGNKYDKVPGYAPMSVTKLKHRFDNIVKMVTTVNTMDGKWMDVCYKQVIEDLHDLINEFESLKENKDGD